MPAVDLVISLKPIEDELGDLSLKVDELGADAQAADALALAITAEYVASELEVLAVRLAQAA